jgi:hypothetical protein
MSGIVNETIANDGGRGLEQPGHLSRLEENAVHPYGTDPHIQLGFARERAAELREDWAMANNSKLCRLSSFVEQCRARVFEPLDSAWLHRRDLPWHREYQTRHFSS